MREPLERKHTRPRGGRCSRKAHPPKGRALIEKSTPAQGAGVYNAQGMRQWCIS